MFPPAQTTSMRRNREAFSFNGMDFPVGTNFSVDISGTLGLLSFKNTSVYEISLSKTQVLSVC